MDRNISKYIYSKPVLTNQNRSDRRRIARSLLTVTSDPSRSERTDVSNTYVAP